MTAALSPRTPAPLGGLAVHLLMVCVALIWGFAYPAIRVGLQEGVPPQDLAIYRFWFGSLGFAVVLLFTWNHRPHLTRAEVLPLLLMALFGIVGYHLAINYAEVTTTAGRAAILVAASPLLTALFARLRFGDRISRGAALGLPIAFLGVLITLFWGSREPIAVTSLWGPSLVLVAATAWAAYTVVAKPLVTRMDPLFLTAYATFLGTALLLPTGTAELFPSVSSLTPWAWAAILYLGLMCSTVGYAIWNLVLKVRSATTTAFYVYLIPIVSAIAGWAFLDESVTPLLALGGALIISGVALGNSAWVAERLGSGPEARPGDATRR